MLTGLLEFQNKKKYNELLTNYIEGNVESVYEELWDAIDVSSKIRCNVIFIGDICELVYENIYKEIKMDLIYEATERKDYEIYGCSKEEFILLAYNGDIEDEAFIPNINMAEFTMIIRDFLIENRFFFIDFYEHVRNEPIKEVW